MNYKIDKLANNLEVLTIPMPTLSSATVTIWVRTGSRNENEKISGISHFLEHMVFKGGRKYKDAKAVSTAIDAIGGEFNAATSKEWTKFYVKVRSAQIERAIDVLSDIVLFPQIRISDIKREKGVIIEEMGMYEDTPIKRVWDLFEQLMFKGYDLGRDIIGTKTSVSEIERKDFQAYRNNYYFSKNLLITVAGGIDRKDVLKLAEKFFGSLAKEGNGKPSLIKFKSSHDRLSVNSKKIEQAHFILGFPSDFLGNKDRYKDAVTNAVLGGGMSSRLFTEVREKRGLAYAVKSDFDRFLDAGYFAVYAGTDPKKATEAIKIIQGELYKLAAGTKKVKKAELKKAKEYLKGHLALSLEDTEDVSDFFGYEYLMLKKVRTPEEVFKAVDLVTVEDIIHSAKKTFSPDRMFLSVIGPYKDGGKFENLL